MAITVLPPKTFAETIGQGLGTGLSSGLQALAQQKLQQVQQRNIASALSNLLPQQQATALAQLPESLQQTYLKDLLAAPKEQAFAQALGLGQPTESQISGEMAKTQQPQQLPRLTERQATQIAKLQQTERHFALKHASQQQKEADKETLPIYQEITKEAKAAKANDKRLDRMEQLINAGKLQSPLTQALIDTAARGIFGIGIDLSGLQNADTAEFNKLSKDFLKEAKSIFGSRLTDVDVKAFLQTVPTLLISDEGKKRVIYNLRSFNDAAKIRKNVADQIIAENNGLRPRNLDALVEKMAAPELDKLAEDFKRGASSTNAQQEAQQQNVPLLSSLGGIVKSLGF